jgi:hypothetical protein
MKTKMNLFIALALITVATSTTITASPRGLRGSSDFDAKTNTPTNDANLGPGSLYTITRQSPPASHRKLFAGPASHRKLFAGPASHRKLFAGPASHRKLFAGPAFRCGFVICRYLDLFE